MNILEVYKKYQIMPQLAEHQITVAAVADMIYENLTTGSNRSTTVLNEERANIVKACLLHDMGNIAKSNFDAETLAKMPGLVDPKTIPYWEQVKKDFLAKYGEGSHNMTMKILKEIGVNPRIMELADAVGFSQAVTNAETEDFGKKICAYSDMRVMPLGISSLEQRMADLRVRYKNHPEGAFGREVFEEALRKIEQQIFAISKIKPEDITEEAIASRKEYLKDFDI